MANNLMTPVQKPRAPAERAAPVVADERLRYVRVVAQHVFEHGLVRVDLDF